MSETCTIANVEPLGTKPWVSPKTGKSNLFINGHFADGRKFTRMEEMGEAAKVQADLCALVGKPGDFTLEPRTDKNGQPQQTIKAYPGAPEKKWGGAGGGGKTFSVAYANTIQGVLFTSGSIQAQTSLKSAVEVFANAKEPPTHASILAYADAFHAWLASKTTAPAEAPKPAPEAAPVSNGPSDYDKAKLVVQEKIDAFESVLMKEAFDLMVSETVKIRERLTARGWADLKGNLEMAMDRAKDRLSQSDSIPF